MNRLRSLIYRLLVINQLAGADSCTWIFHGSLTTMFDIKYLRLDLYLIFDMLSRNGGFNLDTHTNSVRLKLCYCSTRIRVKYFGLNFITPNVSFPTDSLYKTYVTMRYRFLKMRPSTSTYGYTLCWIQVQWSIAWQYIFGCCDNIFAVFEISVRRWRRYDIHFG